MVYKKSTARTALSTASNMSTARHTCHKNLVAFVLIYGETKLGLCPRDRITNLTECAIILNAKKSIRNLTHERFIDCVMQTTSLSLQLQFLSPNLNVSEEKETTHVSGLKLLSRSPRVCLCCFSSVEIGTPHSLHLHCTE